MEQKKDQSYVDSTEDSEEDVITNYIQDETNSSGPEELGIKSLGSNEVVNNERSSPSEIPTILLTSTSLKSSKILENNICYLQKIQDEIHRYREQNIHPIAKATNLKTAPIRRLSHSCPSLVDEDEFSNDDANRNIKNSLEGQGGEAFKKTMDEANIIHGLTALEAVNCNMTVIANQRLLGVPDVADPLAPTTADGVKIHINDLTPLGSQECLATRSNISISRETDDYSSHSNRHQWLLQDQGLELDTTTLAAFAAPCTWRRRSWSSTDQDEEISKIKKSLAKSQRSMSLSSLDSETEDTFFDACEGTTDDTDMTISSMANSSPWANDSHREKQRSLSGSSSPVRAPMGGTDCTSYHSLNDYPIQINPEKLTGFCDDVNFKCLSRHSLSAPRTTLQKSVSTPSIVAQKEAQESTSSIVDHHNFSETAHLESNQELLLSKRKKRGSIFSRRKRGKEKELKKTSHHFVTVCYSNSAVCHVCNKSMANKPALHCETCLVIVHENSCKDQISDCSQFKAYQKAGKVSAHNPPQVSQSTKRSSGWIHSGPSSANSSHVLGKNKKTSTSLKQAQKSAANTSVKASNSSKVINEEKEGDSAEANTIITDVNSNSLESLDEDSLGISTVAVEIDEIDDDPDLNLLNDEPEIWSKTVDKKLLKKLKDKEVKKQEAIYELILTEKHHCLTLKIMQKIYAQGMIKELQMTSENVNRIFPKLEDLLEFHLLFLKQLRVRQQKDIIIERIGDLILSQFQGYKAEQVKTAYGEFCSNHNDAVSLYKDLLNQDRKFQCFIKKVSQNPCCKARQIPECILLVTQRMMKYPLIIESLLKNTKEKTEHNSLTNANDLVKDMIAKIDEEVAEKGRKQRLLEIYNKIEAKSASIHRGKKFKKADVLLNNRKLRFDGPIRLNQARGKVLDVIVVLLSDVIFFLQENNQKYSFVTQDNKAGVISLQKLLVRAKAGQESKGIYLISSNPDPEMYEIVCHSLKDKMVWIERFRTAVESCPEEDEIIPIETEEEKKLAEAKAAKVQELLSRLHENDVQLACLCEEKMKIFTEIMETVKKEEYSDSSNFKYAHYMNSNQDAQETEDIFTALQEAYRLASSLYSGTNLGRSVSSAGEHHSEAYVSPILPKRAETFGGFDNPNKEGSSTPKANNIKKKLNLLKDSECRAASLINLAAHLEKDSGSSSDGSDPFLHVSKPGKEARRASGPLPSSDQENIEKSSCRRSTVSIGLLTPEMAWSDERNTVSLGVSEPSLSNNKQGTIGDLLVFSSAPSLMSLGKDHFSTAMQLSHYLNTLMCLISKHFTSVVSIKAQGTHENLEGGRDSKDKRHLYRPNQQLEELRNLQEQLSQDRERWQSTYEAEKLKMEEERERLQKLQVHLKEEKDDIQQQRDYLYRYLEVLQQRYGITVSPNMTLVGNNPILVDDSSSSSSTGGINYASEPQVETHRRYSSGRELQGLTKDPLTGGVVSNRNANVASAAHSSSDSNNKKSNKSEGNLKTRMSFVTSSFSGSKRDSAHMLPINLYSATNLQKAASQTPPVRQQLPLKLASHDTSSSSHSHHHSSSQLLKQKEPVITSGTTSAQSGIHLYSSSSNSSTSPSNPVSTSASIETSPLGVHSSTKSLPDKINDSNQEIIYF